MLEQNRALLLRGAEGVSGPSFNNLSMQLRHCCNHPFLIKGVVQAPGLRAHASAHARNPVYSSLQPYVLEPATACD